MNDLIVYGSCYGSAKRYAEAFAARTGSPVLAEETVRNLCGVDRVILFGALYAGGVKGLKKLLRTLPENTRLVIVTVGLADVENPKNTAHIREALCRQVPQPRLKGTAVFHLRGGIDYQKPNFKHRAMMAMLCRRLKSLPPEKQTDEDRALLETYGKAVDFVDLDTLAPIAAALC